uniref:Uncharacterized protein n=1 Tax=Anguilla anguilla TaxID=7936 RepID=A0A0E9R542_ANGAN
MYACTHSRAHGHARKHTCMQARARTHTLARTPTTLQFEVTSRHTDRVTPCSI